MQLGNRQVARYATLVGTMVVASICSVTLLADNPPPDEPYVASDSEDMDGDGVKDTVIADPSGGAPNRPGEVEIRSDE